MDRQEHVESCWDADAGIILYRGRKFVHTHSGIQKVPRLARDAIERKVSAGEEKRVLDTEGAP